VLPRIEFEIQDGNLGLLPSLGEGVQVKLGIASQGPTNTPIALTSPKGAADTFGSGPLVEACAIAFAQGAGTIYGVRVQQSAAGVAGAITKTGTGTGDLALTGSSPLDSYELLVKIVGEGENLAAGATFQHSLDGGKTFSPVLAVPVSGTYVIPDSGVTLTFSDGPSGVSFRQGDTYTASCTAPAYTLSELNAAITGLFAEGSLRYAFVHVVGAATPTIAAGVDARLGEAEASFRFIWALLEAADNPDNTLRTTWANFASVRVQVGAGYADAVSPLSGRVHKRPVAWVHAGRRAARPIEEDVGRYASGPVRGVVRLYRDESLTPGLDEAGFVTMRTFTGVGGFYLTQGRMKAPAGSDFDLDQYRGVMDMGCTVLYQAGLRYVNESIRVNGASGHILEREARRIESYVQSQVRTALKGKVSVDADTDEPAVYVTVDRSVNLLSSRTLEFDIGIVPLGYAKVVRFRVGFRNPRLLPVAA
jgi:hypothetical protein